MQMHELGLNHSAGLPAHAKSAQAESTQAESKQASAEEGQEQTSECDCSAKRAFSPPYLRIKSSAKTDLDQAEGPCPLSRTELFELRRAVMQVPDDVVSSEVPNDTLQKLSLIHI